MAKVTNRQLAKAFTISQQFLAPSRASAKLNSLYTCICYTFDTAVVKCLITPEVGRAAKSIITDRLKGSVYLVYWLINNRHITLDEFANDRDLNNSVKLQATRLAWMKSMAAEFLAKSK